QKMARAAMASCRQPGARTCSRSFSNDLEAPGFGIVPFNGSAPADTAGPGRLPAGNWQDFRTRPRRRGGRIGRTDPVASQDENHLWRQGYIPMARFGSQAEPAIRFDERAVTPHMRLDLVAPVLRCLVPVFLVRHVGQDGALEPAQAELADAEKMLHLA